MKSILSLFVVSSLLGLNLAIATEPGPVLVPKTTERVFTPHGFDSNDNVQVVLDGVLQSTCYKAGPAEATIDSNTKTIHVRDRNYFYEGCWCAQIMSHYTRTLDLGILPAGNYSVVVEGAEGKVVRRGTMAVTLSATLAPDDFLYAPVTEMRVDQVDGVNMLTLRGTFTNTCMRMQEIRPIYSEGNVIEVLPLAEMETENCRNEANPFSMTTPLTNAPSGRTLVHVRSLNGQSLNQVFEF